MISAIVSLLLLVGAFVVFVNYVQPAYTDVSDTNARILSEEAFLNEQTNIIKKVEEATGSYEQGIDARKQIALALPAAPEIASAIHQLGGIAQINNLIPHSFAVTLPTAASQGARAADDLQKKFSTDRPVSSVTIRMELAGSYEDFKRFLGNVETNIRIFDVKAISFQPVGKPTQNLYSYTLTVAAYYQNQ